MAIAKDEFTDAEKSMLRYLEERFIAFGGQPKTLNDSVTRDAFLRLFSTVDEVSYRRFMARLQARGIATRVAPGAPNEWISIGPEIVDVVRELNANDPPPRTLAAESLGGMIPLAKSEIAPPKQAPTKAKPMSKNFPKGWVRGEALGEGGQAQVFMATREGDSSGQRYAVKLLRRGKPKAAYERFAREIEAVKKLDHPSIIKIIEHSEPDAELQYYVMEFVEGARSLKQLMAAGTNPFHGNETESVRMFIRILEGLERCKAADIVHRDLSPANILVLPDKTIKIIDFGLCQIADGHAVSLTDENIGTPNYMAPECENFSDTPITFCADLYSAAKILWSAVTNRTAFTREEKAFGELSMQKLFPDRPNYWHLQIIFQHSLRHKIVDRWPNPTAALGEAWRVYQLIEKGKSPIDILDKKCPICGWGKLSPGGASVLVRPGVAQHIRQGEQPEFFELACDHCGYCFVISRKIRDKTLAARQNLS